MSEPETSPPPNKRRSRRRTPKGTTKALCYRNLLGMGPNVAHSVLDVSETGLRLLLREELPVGQQVEVDLVGVGFPVVKMCCTVVWLLPEAEGGFRAGFRFDKSLSYADLQAMSRS